jgi:hypothetical protein
VGSIAVAVCPAKQLQVEQEQQPPLGHAVVLRVPLVAGSKAGVDEPYDAAAAVARFDEPLEGEARVGVTAVEDHPVRGFPCSDAPGDLHLGSSSERRVRRSPLTLLDRVGYVPGGDAGAGGDRSPHLLGRTGNLDLELDGAVVGHRSCLFHRGGSWGGTGMGGDNEPVPAAVGRGLVVVTGGE